MKEYPLSLVSDYRSHWSVEDAIREILQNALDDPSSFEYGFPGNSMVIRNIGVSLDPSSLLLGNTTKSNDSSSVGGFGEGFKIALLILCREGYKVTVRNGSRLWVPKFKHSELFGCDMLHITETPLEDNLDLTFIIEGISEEIRNTVIERCLYLQDDLGECIKTNMGRIFKDSPGKLYVGGLFVTDTELKHSYDFHPQYLTLNTDRQSVCGWDLKTSTAKVWAKVNDPDYVSKMVSESYPDVQHIEYCSSTSDIKDGCFKLYEERYNNVPLATNTNEKDLMVSQGYKNVEVIGNTLFTTLIKGSDQYKRLESGWSSEVEIDERSPLEVLQDWNDQERLDVDFDEILELFEKRGVIWDE